VELKRGLFKDKQNLQTIATKHKQLLSIGQSRSIIMAHSVKNRKKRERKKQVLNGRVKSLSKMASRRVKSVEEIELPHVALGDLRRRWRQQETPLPPDLRAKVEKFRRIKIPKDKPLRISGSDGGMLVYGVALNDKELVDTLFESIREAPTPKHYKFRGQKRSSYRSWHWVAWAKYSLEPFYSREYLDSSEAADTFFERNKEVFRRMGAILGQCAPGVFKQFQNYPLPKGLKRLGGAWMGCAINDGGNNPNQTNAHRDASEALYGYSGLISCGDYRRGGLILWELEVILETEPGDVVIFADVVITHSNEEAEGHRSSMVCFTQENVYSYWNREYNMRLRRKERRKRKVSRVNRGKVAKAN